ncbi:unnamed protein product, partial [Prunus brigantina]
MWSIERAWGLRASDRPIGSVFARHVRSSCPRRALDPQGHLSRTEPMSERNATWLIPPVVICLSQRLSHACVIGPWVGSTGPPAVCTGRLVPSTGDTLLALIGRVVPPVLVTLKKLECSKQAYAPDTLAWDNIIGFRSYSLAFGIGVMINGDSRGHSYFIVENPVNHRVFERKLRPKPLGRGHALPGRHTSLPPHLLLRDCGGADDGLPCASPRGWHKCQVLGDARHDNRWLRNLGCPSCAVVAHRGLEKIAGLRLGFQRDPGSGRGYPLNLSISISGGKETYKDS